MVRKDKKPEELNKSAKPRDRRRPIRTFDTFDKNTRRFSKKDFGHIRDRIVRDREGYFWIYEMTAEDELTKNKTITFLEKNKKETKVIKNGNLFEIFVKKDDTYFRKRKE